MDTTLRPQVLLDKRELDQQGPSAPAQVVPVDTDEALLLKVVYAAGLATAAPLGVDLCDPDIRSRK